MLFPFASERLHCSLHNMYPWQLQAAEMQLAVAVLVTESERVKREMYITLTVFCHSQIEKLLCQKFIFSPEG